jgi:NADPH:quinone reductase-like Zn-dependent oxidoreductase
LRKISGGFRKRLINRDEGVGQTFRNGRAQRRTTRGIAQLLDAGKLRVFVEAEYALTETIAGYARAQKGGMHGKIAFRTTG